MAALAGSRGGAGGEGEIDRGVRRRGQVITPHCASAPARANPCAMPLPSPSSHLSRAIRPGSGRTSCQLRLRLFNTHPPCLIKRILPVSTPFPRPSPELTRGNGRLQPRPLASSYQVRGRQARVTYLCAPARAPAPPYPLARGNMS